MDFEGQIRKDRFGFWPWKKAAEKTAACDRKDSGFQRSDLSDFVWLVYSIFFFIEPVTRHSTPFWIQFAIFYAIFLALYAGLILAPKRWQHYPLLFAMWVLGAAYYPQNEGAWGVFVYVAAMMPFISESLLIRDRKSVV